MGIAILLIMIGVLFLGKAQWDMNKTQKSQKCQIEWLTKEIDKHQWAMDNPKKYKQGDRVKGKLIMYVYVSTPFLTNDTIKWAYSCVDLKTGKHSTEYYE